jgi:hypothetical protein
VEEHWRYVPGYNQKYAVSTLGRIVSFNTERLLKTGLKKDRPSVRLSLDGRPKDLCVHTLVLTAFRGPRPPGHECRHLDGDKLNNVLSNLVWGVAHANLTDSYRHKNAKRGVKVTAEMVRYVRESPRALRKLADELKISKSQVANIRLGLSWPNIKPLVDLEEKGVAPVRARRCSLDEHVSLMLGPCALPGADARASATGCTGATGCY